MLCYIYTLFSYLIVVIKDSAREGTNTETAGQINGQASEWSDNWEWELWCTKDEDNWTGGWKPPVKVTADAE